MGYYTIDIFAPKQRYDKHCYQIWKNRYNWLPMGICAPGDVFQYKLYNVIGDIKILRCILMI